ncbi:hypothetical protein [Rhizobium laguerreae]|uniref:hypothetical protein n=1 Tax=Rhizobium laguerreae TaxID=1076926 RepID=UPI0028AE60E3|nr:hypothetical protein [Rhizobium laguerreae]
MTLELDAETISRLIQHIEPDLTVSGFSRLEGGSTEVYKIDVANSDYGSLVLKIYPDKPEWGPSKEARSGLAQRIEAAGSHLAARR